MAQERPKPGRSPIYHEAVKEALVVIWEAADRICGKRLKAILGDYIEAMERHGHLSLDPEVRERLFSISPATIDRLLKPMRNQSGNQKKRRRSKKRLNKQVPIRTFADWKEPPPEGGWIRWNCCIKSVKGEELWRP